REVLLVEVVPVQVGDVEVVGLPEGVPVELRVVGEGEPGGEVGGIDPRVAEDRACGRLEEHAGVASAGDTHVCPSEVGIDSASTLQLTPVPGSRRRSLWRARLSPITGLLEEPTWQPKSRFSHRI